MRCWCAPVALVRPVLNLPDMPEGRVAGSAADGGEGGPYFVGMTEAMAARRIDKNRERLSAALAARRQRSD